MLDLFSVFFEILLSKTCSHSQAAREAVEAEVSARERVHQAKLDKAKKQERDAKLEKEAEGRRKQWAVEEARRISKRKELQLDRVRN